MLALYSRLAPPSVNATMIGIYALSVSIGSVTSGWLGGLYETVSPFQFWSLHAALCALGGAALLLIGSAIASKALRPAGDPSVPA